MLAHNGKCTQWHSNLAGTFGYSELKAKLQIG